MTGNLCTVNKNKFLLVFSVDVEVFVYCTLGFRQFVMPVPYAFKKFAWTV